MDQPCIPSLYHLATQVVAKQIRHPHIVDLFPPQGTMDNDDLCFIQDIMDKERSITVLSADVFEFTTVYTEYQTLLVRHKNRGHEIDGAKVISLERLNDIWTDIRLRFDHSTISSFWIEVQLRYSCCVLPIICYIVDISGRVDDCVETGDPFSPIPREDRYFMYRLNKIFPDAPWDDWDCRLSEIDERCTIPFLNIHDAKVSVIDNNRRLIELSVRHSTCPHFHIDVEVDLTKLPRRE